MKILIVEDDQNKINQLKDFFYSLEYEVELKVKNSFNSGLKEIMSEVVDFIILDMSMPTFDMKPHEKGGSFRIYGGKDILRQMVRKKIPTAVIIVTQFDYFGPAEDSKSLQELSLELSKLYPDNYKGTVYYNPAINNWKKDLFDLLSKFSKTGREDM